MLDLTVFTANTFIFICHSQSLQAALDVDEDASKEPSKEFEENECATVHLDIVNKKPDVCTKGTQRSLQKPSRRSKGEFIVSINLNALSFCAGGKT